MKYCVIPAVFLLFLASSAQTRAELVFATFESPTYALGSVVGQDGWVAEPSNNGGAAMVDNTRALQGTQSLLVDTATLNGPSWWYKSFSVDAAGRAVEFQFDMFLESNLTNDYSIFGVDVYGSSSNFSIFRLWTEFDFIDDQTYINTTEGLTFVPVTRDQWHNYRVLLDYTRDEYDVFFDESLIETGQLDVGLAGTIISDVDIWTTAPSGFGDRAWYDNLTVSVVPEPSALIVLSVVMLSYFPRRR